MSTRLEETLAFAQRHGFYIVAFNHLTPFPGTPLYRPAEARKAGLLYDRWWLDPDYRYGMVPFAPARHDGRGRGAALHRSPPAILQPLFHLPAQPGLSGERPRLVHVEPFLLDQPAVSRRSLQRRNFPLGDEAYSAPLIKAEHSGAFDATQLVALA